jgi:hypothetical protein
MPYDVTSGPDERAFRPEIPEAAENPTLGPVIAAWSKDLKEIARNLPEHEVRWLVDNYYAIQRARVRTAQQIAAAKEEPSAVFRALLDPVEAIEGRVKYALGLYVQNRLFGRWLLAQTGIGPVISAGLLAHIDWTVNKAAAIYRFAGLDPTSEWKEGEKRPWNASLRVICWKAGESFVRFHGKESCLYGRLYCERKEFEARRNASGENAEKAADKLSAKRWQKGTAAYGSLTEGRLPEGQIHARAKRWAVKIFLAHAHEVGYFIAKGYLPPDPYPFAILSHADRIEPMHTDMAPGFQEARRKRLQENAGRPKKPPEDGADILDAHVILE